ncbi:MAG: thioredoxin family protein, partial [Rickettsiales bacterium]|nr:thioredoxin family protein [Rickettsiales bacterium]
VHYTLDGRDFVWTVTANASAKTDAASPASSTSEPQTSELKRNVVPPSLLLALALAFIGGIILNIMPCVLPILALKALSLSKKAEASRLSAAKQGISFTAGVIVSFLAIAGLMLTLKASGSAIGWGFQLQNPMFVGALALIMFLVAANLFGLFELPVLFGARATGVDESKASGSFLTGVLSVLVATPCSAPFMATAIGATLSMPTAQALLVFAMLGFGMAAPFLLISLWPAARRLLPKPGAWMHRFKQLLALPMLATALWLVFVLVQLLQPVSFKASDGHEAYSPVRLEQLRSEGKPVLVDATAAWCLSCKVNERVALKPAEMQQFFRDKNVTLMVADWTSYDATITAYLASFMRNGVPLYVYYPPHGEPVVLPQILTPTIVREAINAAH